MTRITVWRSLRLVWNANRCGSGTSGPGRARIAVASGRIGRRCRSAGWPPNHQRGPPLRIPPRAGQLARRCHAAQLPWRTAHSASWFAAPERPAYLLILCRECQVQVLALFHERPVQLPTLLPGRLLRVPASCAVTKVLRGQGACQGQHANASCDPGRDDRRVRTWNLAHCGLGRAGRYGTPLPGLDSQPNRRAPGPSAARGRLTSASGVYPYLVDVADWRRGRRSLPRSRMPVR